MSDLRAPRRLAKGDLIAVVTPSSPAQESIAAWELSLEALERHGYRVELGPNANRRHGFVAGTPQERAADLQWALAHPEAAMVWCGRGGHGAAQLYPHMDWDALRGVPPKIVQGFSDITCVHLMVQRELGWATFYGANLLALGDVHQFLSETGSEWCFRVIEDATEPVGAYPDMADRIGGVWRVAGEGAVEAPVVGGCLWLLAHSIGTPWELDARGCILLIEDLEEEPYTIDSELTQLRLAGKLEGVVGIVFGEPVGIEPARWDPDGYDQTLFLDDVLRDRLGDLGIPVLKGFPLGHGRDILTVPLGRRARLDADARTFEVLEPGVAA